MNIEYMNKRNHNFNEAVATLVGTIIGAGVLGIPYAVNQAGFLPGLVLLLFLGGALMMLNLLLGEVTLRTHGTHQLTGYAGIYLGKWGKRIMTVVMLLVIYGGLLAYVIGEGVTLRALFGGNAFYWSLAFWAVSSMVLYYGLSIIKQFEFIMLTIIIGVVMAIAFFSFGEVNYGHLDELNLSNILVPYGVIFFALLGAPAIPQVRQILLGNEKSMKKAIMVSMLVPIFIYALFALVVIGVTGIQTTEVATVGLGNALGYKMVLLGNVFAMLAMGTSFLTLGLAVKEVYMYDFNVRRTLAWLYTVLIPVGLFLVGFQNFIDTIGLVGSVVGGLEGILIVLIFWQAIKKGKRKPEYTLGTQRVVGAILLLLFGLGITLSLGIL